MHVFSRDRISIVILAAAAALLTLPIGVASAQPPKIEASHDEGSFPIGPCGSGVTLIETYVGDVQTITFFDGADNPVRVQVHFNYEGVVTNPATGKNVRDPAHGTRFFDLVKGTQGPVGLYYSTTVPGVGIVLHDVGRLVRGPDGGVIFEAGPHDVLHGDYVALFCAALGA